MKLTPLKLAGAFLIEMDAIKDNRGSFARQFCKKELAAAGIDFDIKQCNVSKNYKAGVLRGMHYQKEPYPEIKMVSCFKGAIYDVLVDIRPQSATYLQWVATELTEDNGKMLYVPSGVAHGFQTLKADTVVYYQLGEFFMPDYYGGVRWNDPKFKIVWPECENRIINERDAHYELFQ
ncbi:MAG: dTDP-4-dehydrorhamnose 3,5-epimerase [Kiritimatiellia bacterium]